MSVWTGGGLTTFSAWVGLVPKQNSSGGKDKLGSISKQGDRYLRSLFTAGALAVIRCAKIHGPRSAGMNISKRRVQLVNWQAEGDDNVFFHILEDLYMGNQQ
jgi:hypothetical protein